MPTLWEAILMINIDKFTLYKAISILRQDPEFRSRFSSDAGYDSCLSSWWSV